MRAQRRATGQLWPHWLPTGADEYEFHADIERGTLLYIAARHGGEDFETYEVTKVRYDEPLDDALVTFAPGPDEPTSPAKPISEHMTLSEANTRAPFVVLAPTRFSEVEIAKASVIYLPPRRQRETATLTMIFHGDRSLIIFQSAAADPDNEKLDWEPCTRDGVEMAISEPADGGGKRLLSLERHGTHAQFMSNLDRETLIDLALSLAPVKSPGNE